MDFSYSPSQAEWLSRLKQFMVAEIYPAQHAYDAELAAIRTNGERRLEIVEVLKSKARGAGLWNLFMPYHTVDGFAFDGPGLTNLEYAPLAEEMGRVPWASEVFNCSAPDTGNMEVLLRYGTPEQQQRWLTPLMNGEIRSTFLMTEPDVASSDATNIRTSIIRDGDDYVINGCKWWATGALDPRCGLFILMGKTDPNAATHLQQTQILVPRDAPGVTLLRELRVFGFDEAPKGHAEVRLDNVRVPASHILLGEGRGFEIAQGRLGPGRIHHCMRIIGAAEVAIELMARRLLAREAFGKPIARHSIWEQRIAEARIDIEMARLLTLKAADMIDKVGAKAARAEIAMIKVAAPRIALKVIDDAIQAHGAAGVGDDVGLAQLYAKIRTLRIADGPDEVHCRTIARIEFAKHVPLQGEGQLAATAAKS